MNGNVRDPLVERLIGPGKPYEIEEVEVFGRRRQVFKGRPRNLAGIYRKAMTFGPNRMIVHDSVTLTYDEAFARAASLSEALHQRYGVRRGTMVAVVMANRAEWVLSLIAVTAAGGVAVLVNSRGVAEEMLRAIRATDCELMIADAPRAALIAAAEPDPPFPRILIGAPAADLRPGDADFAELSTAVPGRTLEPLETHPDDEALVLFTSGTTGFPKGALLSHGAVSHASMLAGLMGTLQDMRFEAEVGRPIPAARRSMSSPAVVLGPMFHLGGVTPTLRAMSYGATVFIIGKWNVDVAFDMIETEGLSRLGFVPTMLWDMLRSPRAGPANIGSVYYLASGSALLNPALVEEIRARMPDCLLSNTYGQTENAGWVASISGKPYFDNPAACGWAVPTVDVRVRRDDGSDADVGEAGELWVRAANVMTGYYGDAEATAAALQDGWQATGDIGMVDADGLFSIVDRKNNMVISGGENIYCAEVERVLSDHEGVREVMAYGEPDPRLGERLVATVVTEPGVAFGEEELKAYAKTRLAIYKVPRAMRLTTEPLPRTATGKFDKGAFLRRLKATA
ncbi:class I adenylate-forming enzyme family protein [Phenylobacterium sp.]|uniref:class I adenylate-forming enzyme family protein n=1 Tax=Phenylobacterium sp. TaxID=1871053 RepID=UPI002F41172B